MLYSQRPPGNTSGGSAGGPVREAGADRSAGVMSRNEALQRQQLGPIATERDKQERPIRPGLPQVMERAGRQAAGDGMRSGMEETAGRRKQRLTRVREASTNSWQRKSLRDAG